jgi:broad specificity phosphatase PhoE
MQCLCCVQQVEFCVCTTLLCLSILLVLLIMHICRPGCLHSLRTYQTCQYIFEASVAQLCPPIETTLLREINFGIRENFPSYVSASEARVLIAAKTDTPAESIVDIAESDEEIQNRSSTLLTELGIHLQKSEQQQTDDRVPKFLCVSHGGFIRNLINYHCKTDINSLRNCSISVIEISWDAEIGCISKVIPVKLHDVEHLV